MNAFDQGHAAGLVEAAERHRIGDATSADDAETWFTAPVGQPDPEDFERGFLAGFAAYFAEVQE